MVALNWTDLSVVGESAEESRQRGASRPTGRKAPSGRARSDSARSSGSAGSSGPARSSSARSSSARSSRPAHPSGAATPSSPASPSGWAPSSVPARSASGRRSTGQSPRSICPARVLPATDGPRLMLVRDTPKSAPQPRPTSAAASRRQRVFLWRRMLVVVIIAGLGAAALAAGGWLVQVAGAQPSRPPVQHVYVARPGDTIWGIAVKFSGNRDPRPLADELETQIQGGRTPAGAAAYRSLTAPPSLISGRISRRPKKVAAQPHARGGGPAVHWSSPVSTLSICEEGGRDTTCTSRDLLVLRPDMCVRVVGSASCGALAARDLRTRSWIPARPKRARPSGGDVSA